MNYEDEKMNNRDPRIGFLIIGELLLYMVLCISFRSIIIPITCAFVGVFFPTVVWGEFGGKFEDIPNFISKIKGFFKNKFKNKKHSKEKDISSLKNTELNNEVSPIQEGSIVRDYGEINVPIIETEGSIIRDYNEIAKEKEKYVSLLELVERYKELERIEKADVVNETYEPSGYTYMKK